MGVDPKINLTYFILILFSEVVSSALRESSFLIRDYEEQELHSFQCLSNHRLSALDFIEK